MSYVEHCAHCLSCCVLCSLAYMYMGVCMYGAVGAAVLVCMPYSADHASCHSSNYVLCTVAAWIAILVQLGRTGQQGLAHTLTSANFQDSLALLQVSFV